MHSPLEIARNYIEVGIHKVNLSIFKTILLGFFAGMFIGFAGIASTTASSTIGIASVAKLVGAAVFPAGMAMVLVAGSELFTGNNLIILAVLEKKVTVWKMLKNWLFVYIGNFLGAAFVAGPRPVHHHGVGVHRGMDVLCCEAGLRQASDQLLARDAICIMRLRAQYRRYVFRCMRSSDSAGLRHCSREPDLVQFPCKSPPAYHSG